MLLRSREANSPLHGDVCHKIIITHALIGEKLKRNKDVSSDQHYFKISEGTVKQRVFSVPLGVL